MNHSFSQKCRKRKPKNPCKNCGFSYPYCICNELKKINLKTRVELLIHYKELKRTSNTGRLISSLLVNQGIHIRGQKDNPLDHKNILNPNYTSVLLFPSDCATLASTESLESLSKGKSLQILVPDGNWRQASKVHYRVEELKHIPRVTLAGDQADRTQLLRNESKEDGMSTLEAIANLIGLIEGKKTKKHLMNAYRLKKKTQLKIRGIKREP